MRIKVSFTHNGIERVYERDINDLDRNYDDEPYALIIENLPKNRNGIYEINVLKDEDSEDFHLIESGYVAVYRDMDNCNPDELIEAKIEFLQ